MFQVTSFYARSFDLDQIDLFWEISDFHGDILRYQFFVDRSESPAGPWDVLAGPFLDQYRFRDTSPSLMHQWRTLYYRLRVYDQVGEATTIFGPTAQLPEPDLIALEINRQEDILFREFTGRRVWTYPVRTFGAKCVCFDRVSGRRTKANCLNCYDTGYLGGYMTPIEAFIQIDPNNNRESPTPYGAKQATRSSARLISFPPMKPKDILIEAENVRWEIISMTPTQRLRSVVHQELELRQIEKGDVSYKLPVNISDLSTLSLSAERNFTNPQHVGDAFDVTKILSVYGYKPRGSV